MTKKIVVKDKLLDDTLDLSCCDLKEVPVKEISVLRRATIVDLSNNNLTLLPQNFIILKQIIKLDLSKNNLTELPENFGELVQLKHLDLYSNQISRLPLSLGNLRNLRWLDLKENPLTPAVASVTGPCSNSADCQACARNVVNFLSKVNKNMELMKFLRQENEASTNISEEMIQSVPKKETQKKKKKKTEKEKNDAGDSKPLIDKNNTKSNKVNSKSKNRKKQKGGLIRFLCSALAYLLAFLVLTLLTLPFLPFSKEFTDPIYEMINEKTGYRIDEQIPQLVQDTVQFVTNHSRSLVAEIQQKYSEWTSTTADKKI